MLDPNLSFGPQGSPPHQSILNTPIPDRFPSDDGEWWMIVALNEASPTQSYYIGCNGLPSQVVFGIYESEGEVTPFWWTGS